MSQRIKHFLLFIIRNSIFFALTMRARIGFVLSGYDVKNLVAAEKIASQPAEERFCILAIYQTGRPDENLNNYLELLMSKGFAVLVINSGRLNAPEEIASLCWHYIERPNLGRDFGSYQYGALYLRTLLQGRTPKQVLFCNDSVAILPDRLESFFDKYILNDDQEWIGVTENHVSHYHVSSWFFCINGTVWDRQTIKSFWESYKALDCRPYTIAAGEIGLSKLLLSLGFTPRVIYPADFFLNDVAHKIKRSEYSKLYLLFPRHVFTAAKYDIIVQNIFLCQSRVNQTHFWQIWALLYCDFPFIKKDIRYRGVFEMHQLRHLFEKLGSEYGNTFIAPIIKSILNKSADYLGPLQKLLWRIGAI